MTPETCRRFGRYVARYQPGRMPERTATLATSRVTGEAIWIPGSVLSHRPGMTKQGLWTPRSAGRRHQANRPWQCLNFLPEPHGQTSLRPTLPQVAGSLGLRASVASALRANVETPPSDIAISSSPVAGLR